MAQLSETTPPAAQSGGCGRLALSLTAVAVIALLALFGYGVGTRAGWLGGTGAASSAGAPGILTTGQSVATNVRPAPDFTLRLTNGETFRLADHQGQAVVVNFWAAWCPPCRDEAPVLEKVWQEYRDRGVMFVGVDIWDTEQDAKQFLDEFDLTYPNGQDPRGTTAIDYGVYGIPETFFIDRQSRIVRRWNGPLTEEKLRSFLDEIVGPQPATAARAGSETRR